MHDGGRAPLGIAFNASLGGPSSRRHSALSEVTQLVLADPHARTRTCSLILDESAHDIPLLARKRDARPLIGRCVTFAESHRVPVLVSAWADRELIPFRRRRAIVSDLIVRPGGIGCASVHTGDDNRITTPIGNSRQPVGYGLPCSASSRIAHYDIIPNVRR